MVFTKNKLTKTQVVLNWTATIFWILGFALAFVIPAKSKFIFLPDALLLIGFWPFLWQWRFSLPWIIFGVLNMGIGFILQISEYLPNEKFTHEMILAKEHLANQHSPITWIVVGFVSTVFGLIRFFKNTILWVARKLNKS